MEKTAILSDCRNYRYVLSRVGDKENPYLNVVGLNPSTADETIDDRTISRCIRFAKDWGFGGLKMTNLFAFRATKPKNMLKASDPVGEGNDDYIEQVAKDAGLVLAAWGNDGTINARDWDVRQIVEKHKNMMCLKKTIKGNPWHPLYVKAATRPEYF